jgi:hypothetical protein
VKQTTEEVASAHPSSPSLPDQGQTGGWSRRFQPERPVRTMPVVVLDMPPEDLLQVTTADDQQPVEALGADGTDPTLGVGVGVRRLHRRDEHLGAEHVVEAAGELRVPVVDEERTRRPRSPSTKGRLRACWVTQAPSGWTSPRPGRPGECRVQ